MSLVTKRRTFHDDTYRKLPITRDVAFKARSENPPHARHEDVPLYVVVESSSRGLTSIPATSDIDIWTHPHGKINLVSDTHISDLLPSQLLPAPDQTEWIRHNKKDVERIQDEALVDFPNDARSPVFVCFSQLLQMARDVHDAVSVVASGVESMEQQMQNLFATVATDGQALKALLAPLQPLQR